MLHAFFNVGFTTLVTGDLKPEDGIPSASFNGTFPVLRLHRCVLASPTWLWTALRAFKARSMASKSRLASSNSRGPGLFRAVPRSRASAASPIEKPAKTHAGQSHESKPQGLWKCHGWAIAVPPKRMQPTHSFTCFDFGDMLLIELESNLQFIYLLVINRGNWNPLLMEMSKGTSSINNYK